jgi:hypothetical protein
VQGDGLRTRHQCRGDAQRGQDLGKQFHTAEYRTGLFALSNAQGTCDATG